MFIKKRNKQTNNCKTTGNPNFAWGWQLRSVSCRVHHNIFFIKTKRLQTIKPTNTLIKERNIANNFINWVTVTVYYFFTILNGT